MSRETQNAGAEFNPPTHEPLPGAPDPSIEPERYELLAAPSYSFELTRRDLFRALGAGSTKSAVNPSSGDGADPAAEAHRRPRAPVEGAAEAGGRAVSPDYRVAL